MKKLRFSVVINAPKEKVWKTMLENDTYRKWTDVFSPGSYYVGDWSEGSKILFLAPGEKGEMGMVGRIRDSRPYEYVSIEHLGLVQNGEEDTSSDAAKGWAGGYENYTFKEKEGGTEVIVDLNTPDEFKKMLEDTWPQALQKLKALSEEPD
ncbi:MAG: ATPase [Candidatus Aminicenantes bacterium RBG_16_63_16]|nr:MAG: ATPase [Candidatus Aminicenantes bacterium RBG_16_63_16]